MLVKSDSEEPNRETKRIASIFRLLGSIGFSGQVALAFISLLALFFAASGRSFSPDPGTGSGVGIFWAVCALLALCPSVFFSFRYIRIAKGLMHEPDVHWYPGKKDTIKLLRIAVIVALSGLLLALIGAGASIGILVAKTVSQPPGMAITDPNRIVRALDVFIVLANLNLIAAHFVGSVTSLWLLDRIYRHH